MLRSAADAAATLDGTPSCKPPNGRPGHQRRRRHRPTAASMPCHPPSLSAVVPRLDKTRAPDNASSTPRRPTPKTSQLTLAILASTPKSRRAPELAWKTRQITTTNGQRHHRNAPPARQDPSSGPHQRGMSCRFRVSRPALTCPLSARPDAANDSPLPPDSGSSLVLFSRDAILSLCL
jgi:hypothetical protein